MAQRTYKQTTINQEPGFIAKEEVIESHAPTRNIVLSRINQLVWFVTGLIATLLTLRFALLLMAANPNSPFVDFIYNTSSIFMTPFLAMLPTPATDGGSVVELSALIAIAVYVIIAAAITTLGKILFRDRSGVRHVTREYVG